MSGFSLHQLVSSIKNSPQLNFNHQWLFHPSSKWPLAILHRLTLHQQNLEWCKEKLEQNMK